MAAQIANVPNAAIDIGRMCVPPLKIINAIVAAASKTYFTSPVVKAVKNQYSCKGR